LLTLPISGTADGNTKSSNSIFSMLPCGFVTIFLLKLIG
jgi:hypothetical protein